MIDTFKAYCVDTIYDYVLYNPDETWTVGALTKAQIDDIKNHPEVDKIRIMGLKQDTFEYFIDKYGQQFKAICFFKNKAVNDLSPLSSLPNVEFINWFLNQGCNKLWNMNKNHALKGLSISDFSKLHSLDEIVTAPNLEFLDFGNKVWNRMFLETLQPLAETKLRYLQFNTKKIIDNDISPLAKIMTLEELSFPSNLFETEQIAWLTAKLPNVKSCLLKPYYMINDPIRWETKGGIKMKDTIINGKGKPFLDSNLDKKRINKYVQEFEEMVKNISKDIEY